MYEVLLQRSPQRRFSKQDQPRQTFFFDRPHPAFRGRVEIRAPCWQSKRIHAMPDQVSLVCSLTTLFASLSQRSPTNFECRSRSAILPKPRTASNGDLCGDRHAACARSSISAQTSREERTRLGNYRSAPNKMRNFSESDANRKGGVPPRCWSISGSVLTPCSHRSGTQSAIHLRRVRLKRFVRELTYFSPNDPRKESLK